jgi:polar amino acid transport system substrate-binding protein
MKAILACLAATLFATAELQAHEAPCGPYQVAFYETGLLYFKNEAGDYVGIDRDVVEEVGRRTGCTLVRVMESRVRTWTGLAAGTLDMTVSGIETLERQRFASFIPYLLNNRNYLILRNDRAATVRTMDEFKAQKSLRLGVIKSFVHGATLDPWIEALRREGRVHEVPDLEVLARVFASGRVDAFLSQPVVWGPLLKRNQLDGTVQMLDIAPRDNAVLALVLSRQRIAAVDVDKMRNAIETMRTDGTLEAIYSRYVARPTARALAAPQ